MRSGGPAWTDGLWTVLSIVLFALILQWSVENDHMGVACAVVVIWILVALALQR